MTSDSFVSVLRSKAIAVKEELGKLIHEHNRLDMEEARAKQYLNKLNEFLIAEGEKPVDIPEEEGKSNDYRDV